MSPEREYTVGHFFCGAGVLRWYRTSRHHRELYSAPSEVQP